MKTRVHLVGHDAGGAEILSAWFEKYRERYAFTATLDGPAARIFQRDRHAIPHLDLGAIAKLRSSKTNDPSFVLTGSSLEADLERRAIATARAAGVHVVTFLDHWDLFWPRFGTETEWRNQLPSEIWVGDVYAYDYALREGLPKERLQLVENPYFEKIIAGAKPSEPWRPEDKIRILYICEPFSRKLAAVFGAKASEYDREEVTLAKFLEAAASAERRIEQITFRLHPLESVGKYDAEIAPFRDSLPIRISSGTTLLEDIEANDWIVGVESNALVVGLLLKKRVKSCVTGKPFDIALPHLEIEKIRDMDRMFAE